MVSRPNAAKSFAKQLGWQESLVKLFIFRTFDDLPVNNSDHQLSSNLISEVTKSEITSDSTVFCSTVESDDVDNSQCDVSTICDNHKPGKHPDNLNLFLVCDNVSLPSPKTPGTPMFLNHIDDFNSSSEDLRLRSMSRSSTASLEDLSSSRRSQDRDSRISGFSINGPVDMNASISSFSDSRRSSGNLENEDLQQALDKLGIQSYLKDSGERLEEVCQNVIVILLMIMTKGVEGSNTDAWKVRIIQTINNHCCVCLFFFYNLDYCSENINYQMTFFCLLLSYCMNQMIFMDSQSKTWDIAMPTKGSWHLNLDWISVTLSFIVTVIPDFCCPFPFALML